MRVKLDKVCKRIYAGGDVPKDRYSTVKTAEYAIPIYANAEKDNGLYGYTDTARENELSITVAARGTIGFTAIRRVPFLPVVRLITVVPDLSTVSERYLYYALRNCKPASSGTSIPQLTVPDIKKNEIELYSLSVQETIADKLDAVGRVIELRQQQLQKLDELVKARFVELFGGIHNSNKYPYKPIQELTDIIIGGTPNRDVNEYWECGTIPWVKTTELQNNLIKEVDEYITEKGLNSSSAKLVPPGTVLIAMYGQGKTRGMTAYLNIEACTNQACACILPSDQINQTFLWKFLILSYDDLRGMAKGGNQPNLNGTIIKNYPILYPPIELQEQFAAFVEQTDKSKVAIQKALDEAQLLFDSLMQKYFG